MTSREVALDRLGAHPALAADHGVDEELRVGDAHGEVAEGAQAHHVELVVAEDDRLLGAPLEVGEDLAVDVDHVGAERDSSAEGEREDLGQQRDVGRGERVAAGAEDVERLAVAEEDRPLALLHDELRADLDLAAGRPAVDELLAGRVVPLDDFDELRPSASSLPPRPPRASALGGVEDLLAPLDPVVERVDAPASRLAQRPCRIAAPPSAPTVCSTSARTSAEQLGVVLVDAVELLLARPSPGRRSRRSRSWRSAASRRTSAACGAGPVDVVEQVELARREQVGACSHRARRRGAVELGAEVLAQPLVGVAARLLLAVALQARDGVAIRSRKFFSLWYMRRSLRGERKYITGRSRRNQAALASARAGFPAG